MRVGIVGAGWAGATCARVLTEAGCAVEVFEAGSAVGGHSRAERLEGVLYEPEGPHVFHTDDEEVAAFVHRFGMGRPYRFEVLARIHPTEDADPVVVSWPPQVEELRRLAGWTAIERELEERPAVPRGADFETYAISVMGPTLYRWFVHGYTTKQWGCDPRELSSSIAPRRIDLRTDGDRRLFRDRYQYFETDGFNGIIERIVADASVQLGVTLGIDDLAGGGGMDAWVVTAALDAFLGRPDVLAWRGIETRATYVPVDEPDGTVTEGYAINHSDLRYPFTRTVETKHASGQRARGTVVCEEIPGAPRRHYPVATVDHEHERTNEVLQREVRDAVPVPVAFCGRLANYQYINQDEAIRQGMAAAARLLGRATARE